MRKTGWDAAIRHGAEMCFAGAGVNYQVNSTVVWLCGNFSSRMPSLSMRPINIHNMLLVGGEEAVSS